MLCLCILSLFCFFCFKQKTAYEMRISDWSSDVCSSDLHSFRDHAQLAQRGGSAKSRIWRTTPCVAFTVACMAALVPQALPLHKPGRGPRSSLRPPPSPPSPRLRPRAIHDRGFPSSEMRRVVQECVVRFGSRMLS